MHFDARGYTHKSTAEYQVVFFNITASTTVVPRAQWSWLWERIPFLEARDPGVVDISCKHS